MTIAEAIYDVYEIARVHSKDKDFPERLVKAKFNRYRAANILAYYNEYGYLNQLWYQNHHPISLTKITSGDDPLITLGSITLGKGTIARPVYLPDSYPPVSVTKGSRIMPYSWIDPEILFNIIISGAEIHPNYGYCFLREDQIYVYPYIEKITANGIFDDPTELQMPNSGYTDWRARTIDDPYPIDENMAQEIVIQILVKDFNISIKQISDTLNDGQTKLNTITAIPQS